MSTPRTTTEAPPAPGFWNLAKLEDQVFNLSVLTEANDLIHRKQFSALTDRHLAHVRVYDEPLAKRAYNERAQARSSSPATPLVTTTPAAPMPTAGPQTDADVEAYTSELLQELTDGKANGPIWQRYGQWSVRFAFLLPLVKFVGAMNQKNVERNRRLDELERRLDAVESRGITFKGTHQAGCDYKRGDVVVRDGSLFVALGDTTSDPKHPGVGAPMWALAAARGRDGKDAR